MVRMFVIVFLERRWNQPLLRYISPDVLVVGRFWDSDTM
jgi:hypothetical protein